MNSMGRSWTGLVRLLEDNPDLANAIQNPSVSGSGHENLFLRHIADRAGLTPIMKSFFNLLIEKNRVSASARDSEYYTSLIDEHANVARAQVSDGGATGRAGRSGNCVRLSRR